MPDPFNKGVIETVSWKHSSNGSNALAGTSDLSPVDTLSSLWLASSSPLHDQDHKTCHHPCRYEDEHSLPLIDYHHLRNYLKIVESSCGVAVMLDEVGYCQLLQSLEIAGLETTAVTG